MSRMRRQAERWGAELFQEDVESINVKTSPFTIQSSEREVCVLFLEFVQYIISTVALKCEIR